MPQPSSIACVVSTRTYSIIPDMEPGFSYIVIVYCCRNNITVLLALLVAEHVAMMCRGKTKPTKA